MSNAKCIPSKRIKAAHRRGKTDRMPLKTWAMENSEHYTAWMRNKRTQQKRRIA